MSSDTDATRLTCALANGNEAAAQDLLPIVYEDLRNLARSYIQGRMPNTLQPTALVHEAFLRLTDHASIEWRGRAHFFAVCANAMRMVLADHARRRVAAKRGGQWDRVTLDGIAGEVPGDSFELLALHDALEKLTRLDPRHARLVELRFFAGLSVPEVAEVTGWSVSTIESDWRLVRAWLIRELRTEARA